MGRSRNPCTKNLIINSTLGAWQAWSGISLPCPADEPEARHHYPVDVRFTHTKIQN